MIDNLFRRAFVRFVLFPAAVLGLYSTVLAESDSQLRGYIEQQRPIQIESVEVLADHVSIRGKGMTDQRELWIGSIPMSAAVDQIPEIQELKPLVVSNAKFEVTLPRFGTPSNPHLDRLTSRWMIVERIQDKYLPVSHGHFADTIPCRDSNLPTAHMKSKKGLGGWSTRLLPDELVELGIASVTVNIPVRSLVSTTPKSHHLPFQWLGRTYYANEPGLVSYDKTFREAESHGVCVSAIVLVSNPRKSNDADANLLGHPDCEPVAHYAMPNVLSPEGFELYGAILNLMADRWSRSDRQHGRVHHWIMHNEVDAGREWTNAGTKTALEYMGLYVRSLRLMHLIARQYDPHAKAFISLTHHWSDSGKPDWYGSKRMLDLLGEYCRVEGDFEWGLAFHPYPQSLRDPRTWNDRQATFDMNTKKITPWNLEVLDAYMRRPEMRFQGKVRTIHCSENGFNSKDYSAQAFEDQAAGMALAWKKIQALPSIEAWHYHNWIDNRNEGGLRIGLRKFPDDADDPLGKKPIWHLYQALGGSDEERACQPYLMTIGVSDWREVVKDRWQAKASAEIPGITKRPNILFILTEDQGAHMGALGTPGILTPNMDALAKAGILFRNAYVAYPVCSASKAALYTSLHNHTNGIMNNTVNYHKPASELTPVERQHPLYQRNRIRKEIPTMIERLKEAGYYQAVTHKLHVAPHEKFPYDEFIDHNNRKEVAAFIDRAKQANKPWHLFYNISNSHRPFPNSDRVAIRVDPKTVKIPAFLPDTPVIRQDWSEYLAAIEEADHLVGEAIAALDESGERSRTIIVFMGDHGPCFVHGKMTPYDLGLRVPLVVAGPKLPSNRTQETLVSELDIFPTVLDLLGLQPLTEAHGLSFRYALDESAKRSPRKFIYSEISNRGNLPNDGIQERSVFDGRWHFIYREKVETRWRQVQADSKDWKPWGNRSYGETVRVRETFPLAYKLLTELDPQSLDGHVSTIELYDLDHDPDEIHNLADDASSAEHRERLLNALRQWAKETHDPAINP